MPKTLNAAAVRRMLPPRPGDAHKGRFGTLGVLCGSRRYRGAALLCGEGALRCGAGIVLLCSVEAVCAAAAVRLPGCVLLPLPEDEDGGVAAGGAGRLLAQRPTAILAGCGLGDTPATAQLTQTLLQRAGPPLVLDADALNALAKPPAPGGGAAQALLAARVPVVLTPHIGEMARLCGQSVADVRQNQQAVAESYARRYRCTVVLKSHVTVVAAPGHESVATEGPGNAGLAKGGSGDVLAGIIASLAAQGLPAFQAAAAAVWLHAEAGRRAALEWGAAGMLPQDLPAQAAAVLKELYA